MNIFIGDIYLTTKYGNMSNLITYEYFNFHGFGVYYKFKIKNNNKI